MSYQAEAILHSPSKRGLSKEYISQRLCLIKQRKVCSRWTLMFSPRKRGLSEEDISQMLCLIKQRKVCSRWTLMFSPRKRGLSEEDIPHKAVGIHLFTRVNGCCPKTFQYLTGAPSKLSKGLFLVEHNRIPVF